MFAARVKQFPIKGSVSPVRAAAAAAMFIHRCHLQSRIEMYKTIKKGKNLSEKKRSQAKAIYLPSDFPRTFPNTKLSTENYLDFLSEFKIYWKLVENKFHAAQHISDTEPIVSVELLRKPKVPQRQLIMSIMEFINILNDPINNVFH